MTSRESITASESRPGFFVARCEQCGRVIGAKPTREELEQVRAWHVCGDQPTWE